MTTVQNLMTRRRCDSRSQGDVRGAEKEVHLCQGSAKKKDVPSMASAGEMDEIG